MFKPYKLVRDQWLFYKLKLGQLAKKAGWTLSLVFTAEQMTKDQKLNLKKKKEILKGLYKSKVKKN